MLKKLYRIGPMVFLSSLVVAMAVVTFGEFYAVIRPIFLITFFGILPFIIMKLISSFFYHRHFDPRSMMQVKVVDDELKYFFEDKTLAQPHLEWKIKLDDILIITTSFPDRYILKLGFNPTAQKRLGSQNLKMIDCYKFLHFFDIHGNEYILDMLNEIKGLDEVFGQLDEGFGINRSKVEDVGPFSKLIFPESTKEIEPHAEIWLEEMGTLASGFKKFFSISHPNKALLKKKVWEFAKEERLLSEIGST